MGSGRWQVLRSAVSQGGTMALDLALGRYPKPVYGKERPDGEAPPAICLHSATATRFEGLLRHLVENGYRTLTADEYLAWVTGGDRPDARRAVMLSFDDGMGQVGSVAWPLLRRYRMTAVVFLIAGIVPEDGPPGGVGPTLDDVGAGAVTVQELQRRDAGPWPLLTWPEIRRMHDSGVVDFQAHTLSHDRVFTGTRVVDFVRPELLASLHPNRLTMWERPRGAFRVAPPLGAPIFEHAPRMTDGPAVGDDPALREACTRLVAEAGGAVFFERPDWRRRLEAVVAEHRGRSASPQVPEDAATQAAMMESDLRACRERIESHLPGKQVRHLAYPWGVGGRVAEAAARRAGFAAAWWGRVDGRVANPVGCDPMRLARIGEDFLPMMAGAGRVSMGQVVRGKLIKHGRRLRGERTG